MKGDFTRFSHQPPRQYAGVLMQQGRVTLDADWNEQFDIDDHRWRAQTIDTIGRACAPVDNAGFDLTPTPDGRDLLIGPGRIYVDGILVELPEGTATGVVSVDGATLVLRHLTPDGRPFAAGQWVAVHSGSAGEPELRTVARIETVVTEASQLVLSEDAGGHADRSSVTVRRLTTYRTQPHFPADAAEPFGESFDPQAWVGSTHLFYLDVWRRHVTAIEDPALREVALGGPDTATRVQTVWALRILRNAEGAPVDASGIGCADPHPAWRALTAPSTALMSARAEAAPDPDDPCAIQPAAGYRGLENRLYRIEIHEPGPLGTATFKWSRDNGSILSTIVAFESSKKIRVHSLGKDAVLRFGADDRVEVLSNESELSGRTGTMVSVVGPPDEDERIITLDKDVSVYADHTAPRVRRWDHGGTELATDSNWTGLEDGIQVRFGAGPFRTGDHWVIPARVATGDVEGFVDAPRRGIEHHFARLALVTWAAAPLSEVVECRSTFSPLCGLVAGGDACCTVSVGEDGDVATLQQAVDAVADTVGSVRICVLPGVHILPAPVVIRRGSITVSGCGQQSRVIATDGPALVLRDGADVRVEHLWLFSSTERATVEAGEVTRFDVVDCLAANVGTGQHLARVGVMSPDLAALEGTGSALSVARATDVRILGCTLIGTPAASLSGAGLRIQHNRLAAGGVWIREGSTRTDVVSNVISGGRGAGVLLGGLADGEKPSGLIDGVTATAITGNRIEGMSREGISAPLEEERLSGEIEELRIAGNDIRKCGGAPLGDGMAIGGGIYLRDGTGIRLIDNHVEDNGPPQDANARFVMGFGISLVTCQDVAIRGNTVVHNGPTSTVQDERVVLNLGISALAVTGVGGGGGPLAPLQVGAPAVVIHDNVVVTPGGPAVIAYGAGQMSIKDNTLVSQLVGSSGFRIGRTVLVCNISVSPDFAVMPALDGRESQSRALHGAVQLDDNQITTQSVASGLGPSDAVDPDSVPPADLMLGSAVLAFTYDALSIGCNHVLNEEYPPGVAQQTIRSSIWALGGTLQTTDNRVTEFRRTALLSYYGIAIAQVVTGNVTTHCIRVDDPTGASVEHGNIAAFCARSDAITVGRHHTIIGR
ncbi:DUF6519 domain-containing protein [Geodermatophilus sp. URMC 60]